jgi:hypothetical protein
MSDIRHEVAAVNKDDPDRRNKMRERLNAVARIIGSALDKVYACKDTGDAG